MALSIWDYVVFGIVLLISAMIGVYYRFTGGKQKTQQEYMLANREMSPYPVAFSLMASFMSAVTLLGVSSENYLHGTQYLLINVSYVISTPIITRCFLPVFYRLHTTSVYEYLENRFGKVARLCASIAFSLQMVLYTGIVLYAPALALSAATGINTIFAILSIGFVCTFYSTIGGMKAVLITDVFQSILMFAAVYLVLIKGSIDFGGVGKILSIANNNEKIEFFNFNLDPTIRHTVWTQIIGGSFIYLSLYAVNQAQVQRLISVRSLNEAQWSLWISLPILMVLSFSTAFAGLVIFAKYEYCDPVKQGRICAADQLLPLFVADTLGNYSGVTGLFIAGILSGSLSTVSSSINSLAAVTWEDYITPMLKKRPSDWIISISNKFLACTYGLMSIGLAFVAANLKGVLQASLTVFGVVGGPLLGLFTLGMMFPFVSQTAAVPSFISALAFGFLIGFGGPKPPITPLSLDVSECNVLEHEELQCPPNSVKNFNSSAEIKSDSDYFYFYRISYMYYTLIGFLITIICSILISIWFPQKEKVHRKYLSPIVYEIMGFKDEDETEVFINDGIFLRKESQNVQLGLEERLELENKSGIPVVASNQNNLMKNSMRTNDEGNNITPLPSTNEDPITSNL